MRAEIAGLGSELREEMAAQTRTVMLGLVAAVVSLTGAMAGVVAIVGR